MKLRSQSLNKDVNRIAFCFASKVFEKLYFISVEMMFG